MLKWGILSSANITKRFIPRLLKSPRSQVTAIASRSIEKAESVAKEWGIPKAYGSYEELLTDSEINVVYVPLPHALHAEWAVRAAESGKHCMVEKPIATKISDVERMQRVAMENKVLIVEGFVHLCHPQFKAIQETIKSGVIGDVQFMTGSYVGGVSKRTDGSLWLLGCYPVSMMIGLLNEKPRRVTAMECKTERGVDGSLYGILQFNNGIHGCITSSITSSSDSHFEINGSKGRIRIHTNSAYHPDAYGVDNLFDLCIEGQPMKTITVPKIDAFLAEIAAFESSILDGKPTPVPLEHSHQVVSTILALYASAKRQGIVITL
ncbi:putative oxidoreductase ORF334 [Saccoglossus kowalevskii]|uniref:Trans-1,2-dihydrobenzene-1,2-diol dehydrogenase n=1 Tax=Saccoglossus kowalevskii TaxID=10224 RepID=A0ABM0MUF4_SACKO|nr:PREDICTED: trans-1,2-dihydrobenzene-1,2-diol dehydrogenase-like [Saccoglossus kowalevskii]